MKNLPEYPEIISYNMVRVVYQLMHYQEQLPLEKLHNRVVQLKEILAKLPKCEFYQPNGRYCGTLAVTRSHGMLCCVEHAQIRDQSFQSEFRKPTILKTTDITAWWCSG